MIDEDNSLNNAFKSLEKANRHKTIVLILGFISICVIKIVVEYIKL